jgi:hypothetical protein
MEISGLLVALSLLITVAGLDANETFGRDGDEENEVGDESSRVFGRDDEEEHVSGLSDVVEPLDVVLVEFDLFGTDENGDPSDGGGGRSKSSPDMSCADTAPDRLCACRLCGDLGGGSVLLPVLFWSKEKGWCDKSSFPIGHGSSMPVYCRECDGFPRRDDASLPAVDVEDDDTGRMGKTNSLVGATVETDI